MRKMNYHFVQMHRLLDGEKDIIGIKLFENKDPLLAEYIRLRAKVIKKQLLGVSKSNKDEIKNKSVELKTLYERFVKEADSYDKSR